MRYADIHPFSQDLVASCMQHISYASLSSITMSSWFGYGFPSKEGQEEVGQQVPFAANDDMQNRSQQSSRAAGGNSTEGSIIDRVTIGSVEAIIKMMSSKKTIVGERASQRQRRRHNDFLVQGFKAPSHVSGIGGRKVRSPNSALRSFEYVTRRDRCRGPENTLLEPNKPNGVGFVLD
jgi:hypothetical protein